MQVADILIGSKRGCGGVASVGARGISKRFKPISVKTP